MVVIGFDVILGFEGSYATGLSSSINSRTVVRSSSKKAEYIN